MYQVTVIDRWMIKMYHPECKGPFKIADFFFFEALCKQCSVEESEWTWCHCIEMHTDALSPGDHILLHSSGSLFIGFCPCVHWKELFELPSDWLIYWSPGVCDADSPREPFIDARFTDAPPPTPVA